MQAIQKGEYFLLIAERNRSEGRSAQRVVHQHAEFFLGIQRSRWAEKRMLLPAVDGIRDDIANGFPEHILLRHAVDFLTDRQRADDFDNMVIEKGDAAFDGVRHLHAIAEHGEDVVRKQGLGPEIERNIYRIAIFELLANVKLAKQGMIAFAVAK